MLSAANSPTNNLPSSGSSSSSSSPNSQEGADSPVNQIASRAAHHHHHHHHHHQRTLMDMPHNHAARFSASGLGLVPRNHLPPTASASVGQSGGNGASNQLGGAPLLPPPPDLAGDSGAASVAAAMAVLAEERVACPGAGLMVNAPPAHNPAMQGQESMLVDDAGGGHHLSISASLRTDSPAGDEASTSSFPLSPSLASFADVVPYNWQAGKPTIKERISYMFNSPIMADVCFVVGKQRRRIPAHRFVLAVSSAVFDAMFNGPLAANMTGAPPIAPPPPPPAVPELSPQPQGVGRQTSGGADTGADGDGAHREAERLRGDVPEVAVPDVEPSAFLG